MHEHYEIVGAITDITIKAIAAGIGIILIAGPLGCFVVWRRMAYFGDSLAHSALLGIALGLVMGISESFGTIIICCLFAALLVWLQSKRILANDTLLGILAHAALSLGMVITSLIGEEIDEHEYFFGDILSVNNSDLISIYAGAIFALILLIYSWRGMILTTLHENLARAEGVNVFAVNLCFTAIMTITVAISINIIGILLITSLLIIPAATARLFGKSPESAAIFSTILGMIATITGIIISINYETPAGPSIVVITSVIFAIVMVVVGVKGRAR